MTTSDRLRQRAERFLALALEARGKGHLELAEQLTARAMQCLDEANETDSAPDLPQANETEGAPDLPPPPTEPIPQPQQQQQANETPDVPDLPPPPTEPIPQPQQQQQRQQTQPDEDGEPE
jgi:hypothetical protein